MKKTVVVTALVLVVVMALGVTGLAFAQAPTPGAPAGRNLTGVTRGGGFGQAGLGRMGGGVTDGPLHPYIVAALADKLGLTEAEVEAQLDGGANMYALLQAAGVSAEELQAVHAQALQAAADAGVITQAQADWMSARMNGGRMNGAGMFGGQGRGGHGHGMGGFAGNCPMGYPAGTGANAPTP
jgi:hypothetical protein